MTWTARCRTSTAPGRRSAPRWATFSCTWRCTAPTTAGRSRRRCARGAACRCRRTTSPSCAACPRPPLAARRRTDDRRRCRRRGALLPFAAFPGPPGRRTPVAAPPRRSPALMSPPDRGASAPAALRATCWGTRGSIPTPGPTTVRYGGNTSCVEVCTATGRRYVFDAGTGIRALSRRMQDEAGDADADVFVTHYHWDHIQGFPFCAPLYDPTSRIRLHGPRQGDVAIDRAFAGQMSPVYFPVPLEALAADVGFVDVDGTPWTDGDGEVAAFRLLHPGVTYGYRIRHAGSVLAYVPDNELGGADARGYGQIVGFVRGAALLIHDAMFTDAGYTRLEGWG